jgi:hypothetical protein
MNSAQCLGRQPGVQRLHGGAVVVYCCFQHVTELAEIAGVRELVAEVEEGGFGQFIQFVGDALHHQCGYGAVQGQIDVGVGARAALGA